MKLVMVTIPGDFAEKISDVLLNERLAACVQVVPGVTSRYWWKGSITTADESLLLMKTTDDLYEPLAERIRELHIYEVPEIIAYDADEVTPAYDAWVRESTQGDHRRSIAGDLSPEMADDLVAQGAAPGPAVPLESAKVPKGIESLGIVLVGPPGAGKNTQARLVAERFGLEAISAGALLEEDARNGTANDEAVRARIRSGQLVPDEKIEELVGGKISPGEGYLVEGFPKTTGQAEFLDGINAPNVVIYLSADEDTLLTRMGSRLVCNECGRSYGPGAPPKHPGICDADGYKLAARDDDAAEIAAVKLQVYNEKTRALLQHYKEVLRPVSSEAAVDEVTERICEIIGEHAGG